MYPQQHQEFLDFLDSNPEYLHDMRVRLLMHDLIALPEQFVQLVATVADLTERFTAFADKTDLRLTAIAQDVATLKDNVATLVGSDLERRARQIVLNIAKEELGLTKGRILVARGRDTDPAFLESIEGAEEKGLITEDQESDVLLADIIIRARRTHDKEYVHAVFEVSRTIRNNDVERAAKGAAALEAATGQETVAAVIGERIQPPQQALAEGTGVRVILPAMFRQNKEDEELAA